MFSWGTKKDASPFGRDSESAGVRRVLSRIFRERELLVRSDGEVRFLRVSARLQMAVAAGLIGGFMTYRNVYGLSHALVRRHHAKRSLARHQQDLKTIKQAIQEAESTPSAVERMRIEQMAGLASELVRGRTLSWTRLFNDLEAVIPRKVRIVSIDPSVQTTVSV